MDIKIINLSSKDKQPIMLEETRFICIGKQLCDETSGIRGIFNCFLNRHQHIEKTVTLDIEDIRIDEDLVINDAKNLFTIFHDVNKTMQSEFPLTIKLSRLKEPFFLLFNTKQIVDCKSPQTESSREFNIKYRLTLKDENGTILNPKDKEEVLRLQFADERNQPIIKVFMDTPTIQYNSGKGQQKIGTVAIQLPNTLLYAPSVDVHANFSVLDSTGKPVEDFLTLRKENKSYLEISETNLRSKPQANGKPMAVVRYDMYIDIDNIANPMESIEMYTIKGDAKYKYSYDKTYRPFAALVETIGIMKDKQGTELVVNVYRDNTPLTEQNRAWEVPQIDFTASALVYPVKLGISNKATDTSRPGAGLNISNFQIRSVIENGNSLLDKKNETVPISRVVTMRGQEPDMETSKGFLIANGDSETVVNICFNPEQIYSIRQEGRKIYNFRILTTVEFDYTEDSTGKGQAEKKHFKGIIEWNLFKKPNPEWLSIDFGSSAIVCYYGKGSKSDVINLRLARQKVYEDAKKSSTNPNGFETAEVKDTIEKDTPFLSSDILFNDVQDNEAKATSLCSQINSEDKIKYNTMAVLLSPTEKLSTKNFRRQLPCLKVLMGNMYLPDNDHYKAFRYNYIEGGIIKNDTAANLKDNECSLLNIENIFKETYYTLFHYFIQDDTIVEQANKVVLTYPNTYTPHNLMTMRTIVNKTLPAVREVAFVSESDAVATYYMSHWDEYHASTDDIHTDEHILVYDMGAGTLDVTYLVKQHNPIHDKYLLTINGKIGTGRAGNYLDYVIAQILYNKLREDNFKKSWISTDMRAVENEVLEARVMLKSIIKTKIKPALSQKTDIKFSIGKQSFTINPSDILNDSLFVGFLDNVTTNIWDNIQKYVGKKAFKVDTIILSGRSLRLRQLQERVETFASENNATCIMLDNVLNGESAGEKSDRSKTAVVEGAKTYVETYMTENSPVIIRSRRLQASYGVAFKRTGGKWDYHEILNRRDMPFCDENKKDFARPNGPLIIDHVNESDVIMFIQTYLSEEDTKKALNGRQEEFISVMSEVMTSDFNNKPSLKMDVLVDKNNNISLYVDGMETQYKAPAGADLSDEITKQSLWPVSIANE